MASVNAHPRRPCRRRLQLTPFEVGCADQYGIVCFTQIDNELFTFIRDCQGNVFALATSPSALENGCAWRLLDVGAADVIVWNDASSAGQILAKLERRRDVERLTTSALEQQPVAGENPLGVHSVGEWRKPEGSANRRCF